MIKKQKSYREKWESACAKELPKVEKITKKMSQRWGTGTVVIAHPKEIKRLMDKVPKGKLITINQMRDFLAKKHHASITCPITTGIFAWIAAYYAQELADSGEKNTTPYWRTLKTDGEINPKYPGGIEQQKRLLTKEGHKVIKKGKNKYVVEDFNKSLIQL